MLLKCAGCGRKERVLFRTWWAYKMYLRHPYLHIPCWEDLLRQKELDGM